MGDAEAATTLAPSLHLTPPPPTNLFERIINKYRNIQSPAELPSPSANSQHASQHPGNSQGRCLLALGDSITLGAGNAYKPWRFISAQQLHQEGYDFQWTGSMKGFCNCVDKASCTWSFPGDENSQQHEGHTGWTSGMVLNGCPDPSHCPFGNDCSGSGRLEEWAKQYQCTPTCTLIHLGSNDMREKKNIDASTAIANLRSIIKVLRQISNTTILLAVPIPSCDPKLSKDLSPLIPSLEHHAGNVYLVRQDIGFDPATDLKDKCHPNTQGNEKMAKKWHSAIMKHCI